MGCALRAVICAYALCTFGYSESWVMMMITGMFSSISASGPCLSSPARMPSECMYEISLILSAPSKQVAYLDWIVREHRTIQIAHQLTGSHDP